MAPPESPPDQQEAVAFFDDGRIHEVRLWMSDDDFTSIIQDTRGDEMRSATFSIDGVVMARVGVRPSGESSRVPGNQKMSMRIEFDAFDKGKRMGGSTRSSSPARGTIRSSSGTGSRTGSIAR